MEKILLSQDMKALYTSTKKTPFLVNVPSMNYLVFDGCGHPNEKDFQLACEVLYTLSYIIKFEIIRKQYQFDYKVSPMEVTWYLDKSERKTTYSWSMLIMQPDVVNDEIYRHAIKIAKDKGKVIEYDRTQFKTVDFGKCIQCFHQGDYNNMNDTLQKMQAFAKTHDLKCEQYTHDIYLNDMRKTKIANYKTIMRTKVIKL